MKPFCGYNMGDYFQHWFNMATGSAPGPAHLLRELVPQEPRGKWLWPGYRDNSRVLKWMCDRVSGKVGARKTPIGLLPKEGELDLTGLSLPAQDLAELLRVERTGVQGRGPRHRKTPQPVRRPSARTPQRSAQLLCSVGIEAETGLYFHKGGARGRTEKRSLAHNQFFCSLGFSLEEFGSSGSAGLSFSSQLPAVPPQKEACEKIASEARLGETIFLANLSGTGPTR